MKTHSFPLLSVPCRMRIGGPIAACLMAFHAAAGDFVPLIDSVSAGIGRSNSNGIDIYRLALRKESGVRWLTNPTGSLTVDFEASLNVWKRGGDEIYGAALSPVFRYFFGDGATLIRPYVEAGIGVAGISETELGPRDLSTAFQFEDRVGVGAMIKRFDLSFRYMHYSNGSIKEPNDGIDLFIITLGCRI